MSKTLIIPINATFLCPTCRYPLYGSASRGRNGTRYPAYHCNKRHHYFRVSVDEFEKTIKNFVARVRVTKEGVEKLKARVLSKWQQQLLIGQRDVQTIDEKINDLEKQKIHIGDQLMKMSSVEAIGILEGKLKEVVKELKALENNKAKQENENINMEVIMAIVGEFLENLTFLLLGSPNPLKRAAYFGILFTQTPTYQDLISGTASLAPYLELIDERDPPDPATVSHLSRSWNQIFDSLFRVYKRLRELD